MLSKDKAALLAVSWLEEHGYGTAAQLRNATTNTFEDQGELKVTVSLKIEGEYTVFDLSVATDESVKLIRSTK